MESQEENKWNTRNTMKNDMLHQVANLSKEQERISMLLSESQNSFITA